MELRLILGDQLNAGHSWFRTQDAAVCYLMAELRQETDYCRHHRQKVLAFFAAMRAFAAALTKAGHRVCYLTLDESAPGPICRACWRPSSKRIRPSASPGRARTSGALQASWRTGRQAWPSRPLRWTANIFSPPRWLATLPHSRMEFFYRALRKQYRVLLDEARPAPWGRWNFDAENRAKLPASQPIPAPLTFANEVSDIDAMLTRHGVATIGSADADALPWPVTRRQSRALLEHFLAHCLPHFGRYQDALSERGWSLFHSRLSFSMNSKMLHPLEVIRAAQAHWQANQATISLAQVEGSSARSSAGASLSAPSTGKRCPSIGAPTFSGPSDPCPVFLEWRNQHGLRASRHSTVSGARLCPPYPAADGDRQLRPAGGDPP